MNITHEDLLKASNILQDHIRLLSGYGRASVTNIKLTGTGELKFRVTVPIRDKR